jgi:hypothetical protein
MTGTFTDDQPRFSSGRMAMAMNAEAMAHLNFMKKQQWNVAYYAILLLAAVFAVKRAFEPPLLGVYERWVGTLLCLAVLVGAVLLLSYIQRDIGEHREGIGRDTDAYKRGLEYTIPLGASVFFSWCTVVYGFGGTTHSGHNSWRRSSRRGQRMSKSTMKVILAGLSGAILALAMPASAKFIGTTYYMPSEMLKLCRSDIDRGQAGFCTGYVIATWEQMAGAGEVCTPQGIEYEEMLRALVGRLEVLAKENIRVAISLATQGALRFTWPCKR